jgi:hypothetical protein
MAATRMQVQPDGPKHAPSDGDSIARASSLLRLLAASAGLIALALASGAAAVPRPLEISGVTRLPVLGFPDGDITLRLRKVDSLCVPTLDLNDLP